MRTQKLNLNIIPSDRTSSAHRCFILSDKVNPILHDQSRNRSWINKILISRENIHITTQMQITIAGAKFYCSDPYPRKKTTLFWEYGSTKYEWHNSNSEVWTPSAVLRDRINSNGWTLYRIQHYMRCLRGDGAPGCLAGFMDYLGKCFHFPEWTEDEARV